MGGGSYKKPINRWGDCLKKEDIAKKKGVMFLREVDTLMHTRLAKKCHSIFVNSMRPRGAIDDQLFLT